MLNEVNKRCVNCRNNIRIERNGHIECICSVDKHYIEYVECFENYCDNWIEDGNSESWA